MAKIVIDVSAIIALLMPDEEIPNQTTFEKFLIENGACAPALWKVEFGNSLLMAVRRGRITIAQRETLLSMAANIGIISDKQTQHHLWGKTLTLADNHNLTLYDASYLELAGRQGFPLATLDKALKKAAGTEGVPLYFDPRHND